jgi:hypothetical protein
MSSRDPSAAVPGASRPPDSRAPAAVDRADFDPHYDPDAPIICEMCGNEMVYTAACKIMCRRCGYKRDCSDP